MPKKNGRRKKTRTHVPDAAKPEDENTPMSFVFKMGKVPTVISELVADVRRAMLPFTADKLREKRKNTLKDFIAVGAPLGVTHFVFFTNTEAGTNLKIARIPRGPTLSFKVVGYSLMSQVHLVHRRPVDTSASFSTKPLVVLNNFTGAEDHIKLMNVTFQNMFPPIDVQTVKLAECRRVVLFNYEKETDTVEFRQYVVRANPLGLTKSVKNIVRAKIPNLSKLEDISEYVLGRGATGGNDGGVTSDSEAEDESTHVTLPDSFRGRGNQKSEKSAVRLTEIGPRLTLKLTKVEREVCEGDVLYHAYITKSPEEAAKDKAKREMAQALKRKRREEQEANVDKKNEARDAKKQRKLERKKAKQDGDDTYDDGYKPANGNDSDVDDAEYYRQEVGEEPDAFMFDKKDKKKEAQKKAHLAAKPQQKHNEMAPSDKAARFRFRKNQEAAGGAKPKGKVVRQRPAKGGKGGKDAGGGRQQRGGHGKRK